MKYADLQVFLTDVAPATQEFLTPTPKSCGSHNNFED